MLEVGSWIPCLHCKARLRVRESPNKHIPMLNCANCGIQVLWHGYRTHVRRGCPGCKPPFGGRAKAKPPPERAPAPQMGAQKTAAGRSGL